MFRQIGFSIGVAISMAAPLCAAVNYSYIAVPPSTIVNAGSNASVELYLQEAFAGSSSLLAADGGLFNAGVSVTSSGGAIVIQSINPDPAFGGPVYSDASASGASLLEGVALTAMSGPVGSVDGTIRLVPIATLLVEADGIGQTTFTVGDYNSLGGNTLDFSGNDLDFDNDSPAYDGASDQTSTFTITSIPEPAAALGAFSLFGCFCATRKRRSSRNIRGAYHVDWLENRLLLSGSPLNIPAAFSAAPTFVDMGLVSGSAIKSAAQSSILASPFNPSEIRQAYGVNAISFFNTTGDGSGQTIAIIDVYNDPNIVSDAQTFSSNFGLPRFNVSGGPTLSVVNENGQAALPSNATPGTWDVEESLDVEWAHAIAPRANIVLFEASSSDLYDLMTAVDTARHYAGVDVVSMSWGGTEFFGEQIFDSYFTTPAGHQGVTFLASAGDIGGSPQFPATSPNVIGAGGTSLTINSNGTYASESAWSSSGGGVSYYQLQPSYQVGEVNGTSISNRTSPDVSIVTDPSTGVLVWDTYLNSTYYLIVGGTSLASPMWAGLIAIADQARSQMGLSSMDGATMTLPRLYQLSSADFHDIVSGSNGYDATVGYDLATGLGTPIANLLVPALAGYVPASHLAFSSITSSTTAGVAIPTFTVTIEDPTGAIVTANPSSITVTLYSGPNGAILDGTTTVATQNGVATFSGLSLKQTGTYTLYATDGVLSPGISSNFTITPSAAAQLVFLQQPGNDYITSNLTPVAVAIEDAYGNAVTGNNSTVSLSVYSGPGSLSGGVNMAALGGVAIFSELSLTTAGSYMLEASDGTLEPGFSGSFTINPAKLVFTQQPSGSVINQTISPVITVALESPTGMVLTQSSSAITLSVITGAAGGVLSGTTVVSTSSGIATFSDISLNLAGDYTLSASGQNLLAATSATFSVVDPPNQLTFSPDPTNAIAQSPVHPFVYVDVEDLNGNVIPTDHSTIMLSIASGPAGASLGGVTSATANQGIATFTDLIFSAAGIYTLQATDPETGAVISMPISVSAPNYALQDLVPLTESDVVGSLISDSAGNLYGLTDGGVNGSANDGTIFEIPAGTMSVNILASFASPDILPSGNLAIDADGNLYGTTQFGGEYGYGTIFELPVGTQTINTLASFTGDNGDNPVGGVVIDPAGNLYGSTYNGGYGDGTVFELPKGSSSIVSLYAFGGFDGDNPFGPVMLDGAGNLWGTTEYGGDFNSGTVFEISAGTGTFRTIASLAGPNGEHPAGNLIEDESGNVFGTTYQGGTANEGTLFEISAGHLSTLVNFTGANGESPYAGLTEDTNGNLYGITLQTVGGVAGDGMIYELPKGSSSVVMLANFNGFDGQWPYGGLTETPSGNLFGVSAGGGRDDGGAVYELVAPQLAFGQQPSDVAVGSVVSPAITVKLSTAGGSTFGGDNSNISLSIVSGPAGGALTGSAIATAVDGVATFAGVGFTVPGTYSLAASDLSESALGTMSQPFTVTPAPAPAISSFLINGGAAQRSMDTLLTISFNQPVNLTEAAVSLTQRSTTGGSPLAMSFSLNSPDDGTTWNITFPSYTGASLPDGVYDLTVVSADVTSQLTGQPVTGADQTFTFHRLFGDYDGNGTVNLADYADFLSAYGQTSASQLYNPIFDYDGNGIINGLDYLQFKLRFGTSLVY